MNERVRVKVTRGAGAGSRQEPALGREMRPALDAAWQTQGEPLDAETREFMEEHFGHDFGQVRIHSDEPAAEAARALNAEAFTAGTHLFFAPGRYDPQSAAGRELLAHELAHVAQDATGGGGRSDANAATIPASNALQPRGTVAVSGPTDAFEGEAAAAARQVAAGRPLAGDELSPGGARDGVIARQASPFAFVEAIVDLFVDPAQLVNSLVNQILSTLQADPEDRNGRVRRMMANLTPDTRELRDSSP